jgi:MarR family 2-MHQ and catechol resistance regulon transcriptional repressor
MSLQNELGLQQPFNDLRHETALNIVRTATLLTMKGAQIFRQYDLTEAQFNVLFALKFTNGDITQAELGKRLVVTRASITSVLDKLESKQLVNRKTVPGNRRIHHVELTREGAMLIEKVEPFYRAEIHEALSGFQDEDCKAIIQYMETTRAKVQTMMNE